MIDAPRFRWTRHASGSWSANGYTLTPENRRRDRAMTWRIAIGGVYTCSITGIRFAKGFCEIHHAGQRANRR